MKITPANQGWHVKNPPQKTQKTRVKHFQSENKCALFQHEMGNTSSQADMIQLVSDKDTTGRLNCSRSCIRCLHTLSPLGCFHDASVLTLKSDGFLLHCHECGVDLFGNISEVVSHALELGNDFSLGLLKEDTVDEAPAFAVFLQLHDLLEYHPIRTVKNQLQHQNNVDHLLVLPLLILDLHEALNKSVSFSLELLILESHLSFHLGLVSSGLGSGSLSNRFNHCC